jgi:hypothetical protein
MRLPIILCLIGASTAFADTTVDTPLVDTADVDAPCRALAQIPRTAKTPRPAYDAAISTASCMAMTRADALVLAPTAESARELGTAVAPALAILDRVIETGDPEHRLIAEYAKADILDSDAARIYAASPLSPQVEPAEVAGHRRDVAEIDAATSGWREEALASRREIARLVYEHPELATRDPVIAGMVAKSRIVDAAGLSGPR